MSDCTHPHCEGSTAMSHCAACPSAVDALPAAREEVLAKVEAALERARIWRSHELHRVGFVQQVEEALAALRSLRLQPAAQMPVGLTEAQIEEIASAWDECHIDSPGGEIEVGPALRRQLRAIAQGWA